MKAVLTALTGLAALTMVAATAQADVTIYRGSKVETVKTGGKAPVVLRGSGSLQPQTPSPARQPHPIRIFSGSTLWLVNEDDQEVTACSLRDTAYVGRREIVCARQH
jgi:hypothetical protein